MIVGVRVYSTKKCSALCTRSKSIAKIHVTDRNHPDVETNNFRCTTGLCGEDLGSM